MARPSGAAGRAPRAARSGASRARRSRAALPQRSEPQANRRVRRTTMTARAAILAVALASVALALALPFKVWLAQRGQIEQLRSQTQQQEQRVADLQHQQQEWQDPAYVERQARLRLHYVRPGETEYVVLGNPPARKQPKPQQSAMPRAVTGPWYSRLWQTVTVAGAGDTATP